MSIFDQAYDEMTLTEVCSRLPGELASRAIYRRVNDLPSLLDFIKSVGTQPSFSKDLKLHINSVVAKIPSADLLSTFEKELHHSLFHWLDDDNKNRLKNEGKESLDTKFLFNLAKEDDLEVLSLVLTKTLAEPIVKQSAVLSVLDKADPSVFPQLLDVVIKDQRPEVKECILAVSKFGNKQLIGEMHKLVALKAFVKSGQIKVMNRLDFKLFSALKPKERIDAISKYFNYFPKYRKLRVFDSEPTEDEFSMILFAGCLEHNDVILKLKQQYKDITEEDDPHAEEAKNVP